MTSFLSCQLKFCLIVYTCKWNISWFVEWFFFFLLWSGCIYMSYANWRMFVAVPCCVFRYKIKCNAKINWCSIRLYSDWLWRMLMFPLTTVLSVLQVTASEYLYFIQTFLNMLFVCIYLYLSNRSINIRVV
jgi:hypothetical protein